MTRMLFAAAISSLIIAASTVQTSGLLASGGRIKTQLQPFAAEARQIESILEYFGQPLPSEDREGINKAMSVSDEQSAVTELERVLDKHALAVVEIDARRRARVTRGSATPKLVQNGTVFFLVKVVNRAGVVAPLSVKSPNAGPVYKSDYETAWHPAKSEVTSNDVDERWVGISFYDKPPFSERLSGLGLEYRLLVIGSRDSGQRSATVTFNIGDGVKVQNEMAIPFDIAKAHVVRLHVLDEKCASTIASFTFRDSFRRVYPSSVKRLAPDFFFQPQIYRADGEFISLPPGLFTVTVTGGPEFIPERREFAVDENGPAELSFQLKRWINPASFGWYSGDHHIHAAGCSHYQNPTLGVEPKDMDRQVRGEHLNVGCVLNWAPCYYHQKQFFCRRQDDPLSRPSSLLHYDLEVSGFPSSHSGHLVLLDLAEQSYPGSKRIEDWPTWDLPVLRWAKSQDAITGFAHSGWGLELQSPALPNYEIPSFDGIGANEYVVDVTYPNLVDFISAGDTPYPGELNVWYHTLNVGFRTRISGETDFPCIDDNRVGEGRTYAKVNEGALTYSSWTNAIRKGVSYVSDGRSHLMNFAVNELEVGTGSSELHLQGPSNLKVKINAAAYLDPVPDQNLRALPFDQKPYWSIERARITDTRRIPVEVVLNGRAVARQEIDADGSMRELSFDIPVRQSSWIAVRILPSSHTNPIFVIVDGKPIRASRQSASWCVAAVNQCWSQKAPKISPAELGKAREAYNHALDVYRSLLLECLN